MDRMTYGYLRVRSLAAARAGHRADGAPMTRLVLKADRLPGGLADKKTPDDFDPASLAAGVTVELEHTRDRALAREIAMDHLTEDPHYYTKLKRMEKVGKTGKGVRKALAILRPGQVYRVRTRDGHDALVRIDEDQRALLVTDPSGVPRTAPVLFLEPLDPADFHARIARDLALDV